jgi:hypothetical protein
LRFPDTTNRCLDLFGAQGAVAACVFRLGFCSPAPATARLPESDVYSTAAEFASLE